MAVQGFGSHVVARGHKLAAIGIGLLAQDAKFEIAVATHTGIRGASVGILIAEISDDRLAESVSHIHHMVLYAKALC